MPRATHDFANIAVVTLQMRYAKRASWRRNGGGDRIRTCDNSACKADDFDRSYHTPVKSIRTCSRWEQPEEDHPT